MIIRSAGLIRRRAPRWALLWALLSLFFGSHEASASQVQTMVEGSGPYRVGVISYRDLPFQTVVRQQYDFSCGSASLATLLRYQIWGACDRG